MGFGWDGVWKGRVVFVCWNVKGKKERKLEGEGLGRRGVFDCGGNVWDGGGVKGWD